jgi:hypothetical protein
VLFPVNDIRTEHSEQKAYIRTRGSYLQMRHTPLSSFAYLILVILTLVISTALLCSRENKAHNWQQCAGCKQVKMSVTGTWGGGKCEHTKLSPGSGNHGNTSQGLSLNCHLLYKQKSAPSHPHINGGFATLTPSFLRDIKVTSIACVTFTSAPFG